MQFEFLDTSQFLGRVDNISIGEYLLRRNSMAIVKNWQSTKTSKLADHFGGYKIGKNAWKLTKLRAGVGFMEPQVKHAI